MSRRSKEDRAPQHVRLYHWMLQKPAWKTLDAVSRAIYIEIAERYMGSNNGRIPYSVREAVATFKIGRTTACRCLEALTERGFIRAVTKGAFSLKADRRATEWLLTAWPADVTSAAAGCTAGVLASKDFARWEPSETGEPKKKPAPRIVPPRSAPIGCAVASGGAGTSDAVTVTTSRASNIASPELAALLAKGSRGRSYESLAHGK